jgi:hypothetical protein
VASREEKKRRLREQRLAQEQAAAREAARKRMLGRAGGALLALAAIAILVLAVTSSSGSEKKSGTAATAVPIPKQQSTSLTASAAAAGCELRAFPNFGQQHVMTKVTYKSNPPTSGPHNPTPALDGSYVPGNPPAVEQSVHALEHGRIDIQWRSGLPKRAIGQLQTLFNEQGGYHALLFENQTNMPYEVAASAWQHYIGCPKFTPRVFDAIRNFRETYTDKAPEKIP